MVLMQEKPILKLDWATHAAAKYAVENWHYSKKLPVGKLVKVGAWESGKFIGVVIFAWGMNRNLGSPYGLKINQCCELVRVALTSHFCQTSRILSLSLKFLQNKSPGIRLVVSFADPVHQHHGGIYQAANWLYSGVSACNFEWQLNGQSLNKRAYTGENFGEPRLKVPSRAVKVQLPGKHRYLMPLDVEMRECIESLRKPYPKRSKQAMAGTTGTAAG